MTTPRLAVLTVVTLMGIQPNARGQAREDSLAIRQVALDYIEGWYEGNPERMRRALFPDLAKRVVESDGRNSVVRNTTAEQLVQAAAHGEGTATPPAEQVKDIVILDVFQSAASVRITATDWVDYLHVGRVDGRWVIINVLWEWTEEAKARMRADAQSASAASAEPAAACGVEIVTAHCRGLGDIVRVAMWEAPGLRELSR